MRNKIWLVIILLLSVANVLFFWPGDLYFLNDDLLHIPLTDQGQFFQTNSVRPLHELLVRLDLHIWDQRAYGYHITALLLHFIVCIQLYQLGFLIQIKWLKTSRQQAMQGGFLAVILFLAYPQSSESLAWILGRTPILSAIFLMITIRLFIKETYKWTDYTIGAFFFAAALFTYEQSILLPIALFAIALIDEGKVKRLQMFTYAVILAIVDIVYIIVRKLITSELVGEYEGRNLLTRDWAALGTNAFRIFFRLVLNPANKTEFILSSILFLVFIGLIILFTRKVHLNKKAAAFLIGMVLLLIPPIISLGVPSNSFESGRYLYLPSVFLTIGIGIAVISGAHMNTKLKNPLMALSIFLTAYWLLGKYAASDHYSDASLYAKSVHSKIDHYFKNSSDTLYIDTLRVTVHGLPVFSLGFKTGVKWFNSTIDTNKIIVRKHYDEFGEEHFK